MVQETFIKFCPHARNYDANRGTVQGWLFTMGRPAAYDIAGAPPTRPLLPIEDSQLPPQYDSVDQALMVLTVGQALGKLPSIYADVMRLVRDGFALTPRSPGVSDAGRYGQVPHGHGGEYAASRAGQPGGRDDAI